MDQRRTRISMPVKLARNIRLMKGLTQTEAAERHGVSAALVSAIENGMRPGDVIADYIMTIAEAPNKTHRTPGGDVRVGRKK